MEKNESPKIKTLQELEAHLQDWFSQCNIRIVNAQVDAARAVKAGNFDMLEDIAKHLVFFNREKTMCMYLLAAIDFGGIQLATPEDMKKVGGVN